MASAALGSALTGAAIQMIGPISETITQVVQFSILDFSTASSGESQSDQDTLVRIRVGADDGGRQNNLGGNTPLVVGYDTNLRRVGDSDSSANQDHISNGQFANVRISGGRQTPTLDFTAGGTDGICISDVYMKWADNQGFAFDGSWFKWCNMDWYHSSITLSTSTGARFQPPCGWLDSDASAGHALVGFRVDMLELQNIPNINNWGKNDVHQYCTNTFQFSGSSQDQYLVGNLDTKGEGGTTEKRDVSQSDNTTDKALTVTDTAGHRNKLVVSTFEGQSAQELCDSAKSRGPDFVSLAEGKYCDMSEKKVYKLCADRYSRDCFSLDQDGRRLRRRGGAQDTGDAVHRGYGEVDRWGPA
ncbi:MAG: hypothetical protein Q9226_003532 [Calogaya cf. arnoldii]